MNGISTGVVFEFTFLFQCFNVLIHDVLPAHCCVQFCLFCLFACLLVCLFGCDHLFFMVLILKPIVAYAY
jgi:hypothetical protein